MGLDAVAEDFADLALPLLLVLPPADVGGVFAELLLADGGLGPPGNGCPPSCDGSPCVAAAGGGISSFFAEALVGFEPAAGLAPAEVGGDLAAFELALAGLAPALDGLLLALVGFGLAAALPGFEDGAFFAGALPPADGGFDEDFFAAEDERSAAVDADVLAEPTRTALSLAEPKIIFASLSALAGESEP